MSKNVHKLPKTSEFYTIGTTLKLIRKQKGLLQQTISDRCQIPISTYRKIEYNLSNPDTADFFTILYHLNVSLTEFAYIHSKNTFFSKENFVYLFKDLYHTLDNDKLDQFILTCKKYLNSQEDDDIQNILTAVEATRILDYENKRDKGIEMCQNLYKELNKKKYWFYWDAIIAQTIIIHIDSQSAYNLAERARKTFDYYNDIYPAKTSKARILLNLIYCLRLNGDVISTGPYIEQALKECYPLREKYLYYDALYKKAEYLLAIDQITDAKRYYKEGQDGLKFLNEHAFARDNEADWLEMLEKYAPQELE